MRRICSTILATALAFAQQPADIKPDRPTFTANSRLVVLDVTVRGKDGKVIENLKASDFAVSEDGKPQKVAIFEPQKLSTTPEPPEELKLGDQLSLPPPPKTTITAEAPGEIQYHDKRLMVFFFDFSSMGIPEQLRAQDAALEYLDKKITKDDMVAILFYTSTVQILTDFTNDRDMLTDVIKGLPIGEMSELAGLADNGSDNGEDTGAAFVADETEFNIFNTDQKLAAIESASKMLAAVAREESADLFFRRHQQDRNRQSGAAGGHHQRGDEGQHGDLSHRCARADGGPSRRRREQRRHARRRRLQRIGLQFAARPPSTIRRRRWLRSRPTPAARRFSIATISRWAFRKPSRS